MKPAKKFKVLTYNNQYVDEQLLYKGLYPTHIPTLYKETDTIDTIKAKYKTDNLRFSIYENLDRCYMVIIEHVLCESV